MDEEDQFRLISKRELDVINAYTTGMWSLIDMMAEDIDAKDWDQAEVTLAAMIAWTEAQTQVRAVYEMAASTQGSRARSIGQEIAGIRSDIQPGEEIEELKRIIDTLDHPALKASMIRLSKLSDS